MIAPLPAVYIYSKGRRLGNSAGVAFTLPPYSSLIVASLRGMIVVAECSKLRSSHSSPNSRSVHPLADQAKGAVYLATTPAYQPIRRNEPL